MAGVSASSMFQQETKISSLQRLYQSWIWPGRPRTGVVGSCAGQPQAKKAPLGVFMSCHGKVPAIVSELPIGRELPGMPKELLSRVHAPIGLDIGAVTPQEIAVSILAGLIAVKHGKAAGISMKWDPPSHSRGGAENAQNQPV